MRKLITFLSVLAMGCVFASVALAGNPPVNTAPPVLNGNTAVGSVMTVTNGTWTNSPTSYYYDWQDCTSTTCTSVSPANNQSTYTLRSGDVGYGIKVTVTAYNSSGHNYANSNQSAAVTPCSVPYPSVLRASGQHLVASNGCVMPLLKGINVQPASWAQSNYNAMVSEGAKIVRTVIFWDQLEPTRGTISSSYITSLDSHIAMLKAKGLYTTFDFYFGPGGVHEPSWAGSNSRMSEYTNDNNGMNATQYLAQRYGNPSSPEYTQAVIGFGINEPTPDSDTVSNWVTTLMSEEATMASWFRAKAPNWIAIAAFGYAQSAPLPNASGSGQTAQWFTGATANPFSSVGGNFMVDLHDYFMCTTNASLPNFDGRQDNGEDFFDYQLGTQIATGDTNHPSYPPSGISESTCKSQQAAFMAPYKDYVASSYANVPLTIGEWGWEPVSGSTTFSGASAWMTDKLAEWTNGGAAIEMQWDYNVNQSQDPWAADPGIGAVGAGSNGWQTATNTFFAGS